jgi:hypothetical protein
LGINSFSRYLKHWSTDDIDYYMDLRAVCSGWRSSTADPKSSPLDPRFRPRQWAMLDEVYQSDTRLFVNVSTGRFVRKDLSLLCMCDVVTGAGGGLVVLAGRTAPYAARVLNPFTGAMISFDAPVPCCLYEPAAHVIGSLPTLVLTSNAFGVVYWADPDSKSFMQNNDGHFSHPLVRLPFDSRVYAGAREGVPLESFSVLEAPVPQYLTGNAEWPVLNNRCFQVQSAEERLVVVFQRRHRVDVFKIDTGSGLLERVKNLGSLALFVGERRCLAVDADKFASVEANCIYYVLVEPWYNVCMYSLKDETGVRAGLLSDDPPFSDVQLFCYYTLSLSR